ncbi:MAG TPA: hypothetical protein VKY85_09355 [Candidatus Angelobacter sp.]|nr:hypothetical protein [Candidatus Angelobacter sp.]
MQIAVDGSRGSATAQEAAQSIPREKLPALTDAQKRVAQQLGASDEAYARMVLAGERAQDELLVKTEMFARLLEKKLRDLGSKAEIENIVLRTSSGKFEVEVSLNGNVIPLRIREDLVDNLFEAGSPDAEERLVRILNSTVGIREHQ